MRRPHKARPGSTSAELQMGPLIDCVFLMLTYFLFTISLTTIEGLLPSELALGKDAEQQQEKPETDNEIVLRLVQTGSTVQYFIDDWPVTDYAKVVDHLGGVAKDSTVVVDSGPRVAYHHVVRLYNRCLNLGLEHIVFPLSPTASGPATSATPRS